MTMTKLTEFGFEASDFDLYMGYAVEPMFLSVSFDAEASRIMGWNEIPKDDHGNAVELLGFGKVPWRGKNPPLQVYVTAAVEGDTYGVGAKYTRKLYCLLDCPPEKWEALRKWAEG